MSCLWACLKWCENHQKGVSGKLRIYSVIKTSRVRQLTDSIKAEQKHSSCCASLLMSEWSYENEMKEDIKLQYILHVSACSGSQILSFRGKGYMWVYVGGDSCVSKCKCFESEAVGLPLSWGWVHGHSRPRSVFTSLMTLLMSWMAGKQLSLTALTDMLAFIWPDSLSVQRLFVPLFIYHLFSLMT